jgi:hypothetical protein
LFASSLSAATLTYGGIGGTIPDWDGAPGQISFDIQVTDAQGLFIASGNSVEVRFLGLVHDYASDLLVRLTHMETGTSRDLFGSIGVANDNPASANFGGNYSFRTGSAGDLWATALLLGDVDDIPEGEYQPTTDGSSTPNDFSSAFAGIAVTGTWRLTFIDNVGPAGTLPVIGPFSGGLGSDLVGWELAFDTTNVPEPSTGLLVAAVALLIALRIKGQPS